MKRVGLLTYHNTRNSGAALQVFALQRSILDKGYSCLIVDYQNDTINQRYRVKRFMDCRNIKELVKWLLLHRNEQLVQTKYTHFYDKYLVKTAHPYNRQTVSTANQEFDLFITGSDQVWNLPLNGNDWTYTLDFVEPSKQRTSYAASFGNISLAQKTHQKWHEVLSHYDVITVREQSGLKKVEELLPTAQASVVLDPTFLLSKTEWLTYVSSELVKEAKAPYILVYTVAKGELIFDAARQLAKKTGLTIIYINQSWKKEPGMINRCNSSPFEFIELIDGAAAVMTTSFHGVALSINLEKPFYFELDKTPKNNNSRLTDLIELVGLEERELITTEMTHIEKINYQQVRERLIPMIRHSHQTLKELLRSGDS